MLHAALRNCDFDSIAPHRQAMNPEAFSMSPASLEKAASPSPIVPLSRPTLHDRLIDRVRALIVEGRLAPGTRIHEGELGKALGVSRTPLREALKVIASEGLVELVPGRGAVVRKLTATDVAEMLDVLKALETLAARLACRNATELQIAALRRVHDEMIAFYESGNRLDYYWRNQAIHAGLAELSGNALLATMHATIQARMKRIRFIGNEEPALWHAAVTEHEQMIVALEARDEARLAAVVARHLDETWKRVADKL
jgi:DNA-binding GntR family transcriptional regulator